MQLATVQIKLQGIAVHFQVIYLRCDYDPVHAAMGVLGCVAFQPVDVINLHLEIQGVENTT